MEFIYTGTTIVTAKFASEVQKVQSILQFQVAVQSLILPHLVKFPELFPQEHLMTRHLEMRENGKWR